MFFTWGAGWDEVMSNSSEDEETAVWDLSLVSGCSFLTMYLGSLRGAEGGRVSF